MIKTLETGEFVDLFKRSGLTEKEFGETVGVTQQSVSRWIHGGPISKMASKIIREKFDFQK